MPSARSWCWKTAVPRSTRLRQMGILRAKEMPEMEIIGVEVPDPYGPYGAKGVGEIGLVPTAGAVANANSTSSTACECNTNRG
jgi:CO/xanthine dehydrogenase Mo-binding subunit